MEKRKYSYDFHRFDGEGGEGLGAEASAFLDSLGGGKKEVGEQSDVSRIEYGLPPQDDAPRSQVGSDANETQDLDAEFAELIGKDGKFHTQYGQMVSKVIQDRFKNQTDLQGQVGRYEQAVAPLLQKYGLKAGDIEGLTDAIAGDDDIYRSGAEESGLDINDYRERLQLQAQAERGRQIEQAYQQEQQDHQMFRQWDAEANELRQVLPNFDLGMELRNPDFVKLLQAGIPVKTAFMATHSEDIFDGYGRESSMQAQATIVNNIRRQASRPVESGMRHTPAPQRKVDVSKFTDADVDEIIRRTENGEKFRFD